MRSATFLRRVLIRPAFAYHRVLTLSMAYVALLQGEFLRWKPIRLSQKEKAGLPVIILRRAGLPE